MLRSALTVTLAASVVSSALAQADSPSSGDAPSAAPSLKACVEQSYPDTLAACEALSETVASSVSLECVPQSGCLAPFGPLFQGSVDVVFDADAGQLYELSKAFRNKADDLTVVSEEHEGDKPGDKADVPGYFPVALVTKDWCDGGFQASGLNSLTPSFAALEGARVCTTGYQKTAGWRSSIGSLLSSGVIPERADVGGAESVPNDIYSVGLFFDTGCVPGVAAATASSTGADHPLCANCVGLAADMCALEAEPYSNYEGALMCLAMGDGDVAFVKHTTATTFLNVAGVDNSHNASMDFKNGDSLDDYRLLCPGVEGGCKPLDEYEDCAFPRAVAHTIVASGSGAGVGALRSALAEASGDADFQAAFLTPGGTHTGHLWDEAATFLSPVDTDLATFAGDLFGSWDGLDRLNSIGECDVNPDVSGDGTLDIQDLAWIQACILKDKNFVTLPWCARFQDLDLPVP